MELIVNKHVFGECVGHVYVVEFQKRGFPHAHIVVFLAARHRALDPAVIDQVVRADIPDPVSEPRLHRAVITHMIHGPCAVPDPAPQSARPVRQGVVQHAPSQQRRHVRRGVTWVPPWLRDPLLRPLLPVLDQPCQQDHPGTCSKCFPKDFQEETMTDPDSGYPLYRRQRHGHTGTTPGPRGKPVDSSWVVPYNPYLLLLLDAHCNVEICAGIKAVKYLFKYMLKGSDHINVTLQHEQKDDEKASGADEARDEVQDYLSARYLTPPEAMWRLFSFSIQKNSHTITRLAVHLEGQQTMFFEAGTEQHAVEANRQTRLTAWFELNKKDPAARQYLYPDIPKHYRFSANAWHPRRNNAGSKVISR
jgi:hypothetical protein